MKITHILAIVVITIASLYAQAGYVDAGNIQCTIGPGTIANGTVVGNISGGSSNAGAVVPSALFDSVFGGTQGDILYRGSSVWTVLTPGTAGQYLQTGGASANPSWGYAVTSGTAPLSVSGSVVSLSTPLALTYGGTGNTTGVATNITATSNSTLTSLPNYIPQLPNNSAYSTTATTITTTNAVISGMTYTAPALGTYLVTFSGNVTAGSNAGAVLTIAIYVGGSQNTQSLRTIEPYSSAGFAVFTNSTAVTNAVFTAAAGQAITIQGTASAGTYTMGARELDVVRLQ